MEKESSLPDLELIASDALVRQAQKLCWMSMLTGLLLGAGASYDFGLPLVSKVDPELKKRLIAYFHGVVDCPKEISSQALSILGREDMNYENMIGYFQLQAYRTRGDNELRRNYHSISSLFYRTDVC
jgi:hypothetical protein